MENGLDLSIEGHFIDHTLLGVESNIFQVVSSGNNRELNEPDDTFGCEIDAGEGHNLMDRKKSFVKKQLLA